MTDDRAEPGGGITELATRPPEEWEHHRPVGAPSRPVQVVLTGVGGPIEVVVSRWCPDDVAYLFESTTGGVGAGLAGAVTLANLQSVALNAADRGRPLARIMFSPRSFAAVNAEWAALRRYDASYTAIWDAMEAMTGKRGRR
jgi:hypothetical protein